MRYLKKPLLSGTTTMLEVGQMPLKLFNRFSKIHDFPLLGKIFSRNTATYTSEDLECFKKSQALAYQAAQDVGRLLEPGWSELKAATLLDTYVRDCGVQNYLHKAFAWFGNRSRFDGMQTYWDTLPTDRLLKEGDVVILDIAPILNGYPADIGYSFCLGENPEFKRTIESLKSYRKLIKDLFEDTSLSGQEIYARVDQQMQVDGYDNIHAKYPFGVLGHRMYPLPLQKIPGLLKPFSWQAYWGLASRGFFSETLTDFHAGKLDGLWAIEPHLGARDFGVKFEEMLWVKEGKAEWIAQEVFYDIP